MENNERIAKLEEQMSFLTEELIIRMTRVVRTLNALNDLKVTNPMIKESVEIDMDQLKLIGSLLDRITNLKEKLES